MLNEHIINRILMRLMRDFPEIQNAHVVEVHQTGSVSEGVISEERDQALTDAIQLELDEYGVSKQ
jgi:hypothetical protein